MLHLLLSVAGLRFVTAKAGLYALCLFTYKFKSNSNMLTIFIMVI